MKIFFPTLLLIFGTLKAYCGIDQSSCRHCPEQEPFCWEQCNDSYVQVGVNYSYVDISIQGERSFSGNLGGLQASYEYWPCEGLYGGLRISWKEGCAENSTASRDLDYVDVQERLGYSFDLPCWDLSLTVFSGFGYRYLGHHLKQTGESPIDFNYNEFYIPVGFLSEYCINPCLNIGLNVVWMPQVFPTVEIVPLRGARWIIKNICSNVLIELPLTYFITDCGCYTLILNPFYEHWKDGQSTAKTTSGNALGLPSNSYNFVGIELNFVYAF